LKFFPRRLELALGALVIRAVQPGVLDQNIQAVEKRPGGRAAAGVGMNGGGDNSLLNSNRAMAKD